MRTGEALKVMIIDLKCNSQVILIAIYSFSFSRFRLHHYQFGMVVAIVRWVFDLGMFVTLGK